MDKQLIPFSHLILYAKGWITFQHKDKSNYDYLWNDLKRIFELDDYIVFDKKDIFRLIHIAIDSLNEFYEKYTGKRIYGFTNFTDFYCGVSEQMLINGIDYELAIVKYTLSILFGLKINDFNVKQINYKKLKAKIACREFSFTYTSCQKMFNETFSNQIS